MAGQKGGKRPGAGRPKGSPNKITKERRATLEELAQAHTEEALATLADVMRTGGDNARVSAAVALLDRGYGKPVARNEHSGPDGAELLPPVIQFVLDEEEQDGNEGAS